MNNDYELLYLAGEDKDFVAEIISKKYNYQICSKAWTYSRSISTYKDYINEASLAVYNAIDNYRDKYNFSTFLNTCIDNHLLNYNKSLNRNKHKLLNEAISLEEDINLDIFKTDIDNNPEHIIMEEYTYLETREKIINSLTWEEELIFLLKEEYYTPKEISEITDNNIKRVYNIIRTIKNKVSKLMSNDKKDN